MKPEEVIEVLKDEGLNPEEFFDWLNGQTVGANTDGTIDIFEHDVASFINMKKYGVCCSFD